MSEFFIQVADFVGQKWAELLALVGGTSGIITICVVIGRILNRLFIAKIQKKNNVPINESVNQLQAEIKALRNELAQIKEELPQTMSEATKRVLDVKNKAKKKAYAKIIEGKEIIEEEIEEVKPIIEEAQKVVEEKVEEVKKEVENVTKVVIKSE